MGITNAMKRNINGGKEESTEPSDEGLSARFLTEECGTKNAMESEPRALLQGNRTDGLHMVG